MIRLQAGVWEAEILPARGVRVMSLRWMGKPVLREPASPAELEVNPMLYGMPFLFPPNRTDGGRFSFEGNEYRLPINEPARGNHIHGLFADAPFSVTDICRYSLVSVQDNTGKWFPFSCRIEMRDTLSERGFQRETFIRNTGSGRMPVEIAFHTTFAEPGAVKIPLSLRWETDGRYLPTGRMLPLTVFEEELCRGAERHKETISGFYTAAAHTAQIGRLSYTVSENFTDWVLFNGGGQEWLCIEPQSGPVNGLNRPDCRVLEPGASVCFRQFIGIESFC